MPRCLIALVCLVAFLSCDAPVSFERTNLSDPKSDNYLPAAPIDLAAQPLYDGEVRLTWKRGSEQATGYLVERRVDYIPERTDGDGYEEIGRTGPDAEEFVHRSRQLGTYEYRVCTLFEDGVGQCNAADPLEMGHYVEGHPRIYEGSSEDSAIQLEDGRVLVFRKGASEIYSPDAGSWQRVYPKRYASNTAVTIPDGRVLVFGVHNEVFNPETGHWEEFRSIPVENLRQVAAATFHDGQVLITGRDRRDPFSFVFDPEEMSYQAVESYAPPRLVTLEDGRIMGGAKIFDPDERRWEEINHTVGWPRLLSNGNVVSSGGRLGTIRVMIYDPLQDAQVWSTEIQYSSSWYPGPSAVLSNDDVLLAFAWNFRAYVLQPEGPYLTRIDTYPSSHAAPVTATSLTDGRALITQEEGRKTAIFRSR